jgi:RHS repeat-associated protein
VADENDTVVQTLDYYPFGATRISSNTGGADSARKYIGQFADQSNLDYLNARYYEGSRKQFLSEDPAFLAIGSPSAGVAIFLLPRCSLKPRQDPVGAFGNLGDAHSSGERWITGHCCPVKC